MREIKLDVYAFLAYNQIEALTGKKYASTQNIHGLQVANLTKNFEVELLKLLTE